MSNEFYKIKDIINRYAKYFKDNNSELRLRYELFSIHALNPFVIYNSSPRGLMMASHVSQILVIDNPEKDIIQTPTMNDLSRYVISKKFLHDAEIIDVISRYSNPSIGKEVEYDIIYRRLDDGKVDVMKIPLFNKFHTYFGFLYKFLLNHRELYPGTIVKKDTYVAVPPTVIDVDDEGNFDYGFGLNANVAMITIPETAEDGIVISESFAKKLKFKTIEKRVLFVEPDEVLLNLYGNDEHYKPFPEIGEEINPDGVLMAKRKIDDEIIIGLLSKDELRRVNPMFDEAVYCKGKVIDIKVYKNYKNKMIPMEPDEFINKYVQGMSDYHRRIVDIYNVLKRSDPNLEMTPLFIKYVSNSIGYLESEEYRRKKVYRKEEIELYRIEIEVVREIIPTKGFKLSDFHGGKSVIVDVWKDEDMPVDEFGNRADIIADPSATVSRLNIGRMYERYIKAASREAKRQLINKIRELLNLTEVSSQDVDILSDEQVVNLFKEYVIEFVNMFDTEQKAAYNQVLQGNDIVSMREIIKEIVDEEFYIYLTLDNPKRAYEIVVDIELSKFKPPYGKVKFNYYGTPVETKNPVMIAPMYYILLSKIADDYLVTSSAKLNHFGTPITVSSVDKHRLPHRNSPTRVLGETETRLYASYCGREFLAELRNRNSSIEQHATVYRNILNADEPTDIDDVIPRDVYPYKNDRPLTMLEALFHSVGLDLKYTEDIDLLHEPQQLKTNENLGDDIEIYEEDKSSSDREG